MRVRSDVEAGQAVYTKQYLSVYDVLVLGLTCRFVWKCPSKRILDLYNRHVTGNHLDVGVGTGYFLNRCKFPSASPRVALMDLNANALEFTARRIGRYRPEMYRRNVLEPIVIDAGKFDSVGISCLLHCLPGSIGSKAVALDYLKALMNSDGVLFGTTILQDGIQQSWIARRMAGALNTQGIFSNRHDYLDGLKSVLTERFRDVSIDIAGCAALFSGRV